MKAQLRHENVRIEDITLPETEEVRGTIVKEDLLLLLDDKINLMAYKAEQLEYQEKSKFNTKLMHELRGAVACCEDLKLKIARM